MIRISKNENLAYSLKDGAIIEKMRVILDLTEIERFEPSNEKKHISQLAAYRFH